MGLKNLSDKGAEASAVLQLDHGCHVLFYSVLFCLSFLPHVSQVCLIVCPSLDRFQFPCSLAPVFLNSWGLCSNSGSNSVDVEGLDIITLRKVLSHFTRG